MIKKAVIVAAGLSSRLYPLTLEKPKGLLEINQVSLLQRSIDTLKNNNIEEIYVVTGYKHELMKEKLGADVKIIFNPFYEHCNNMGSLWFAKNEVRSEPFLYLHGDLIYETDMLARFLKEGKTNCDLNLLTDYGPVDEEAMKVKLDKERYLIESNKEIPLEESQGEWTGIAIINSSEVLFNEIEKIMTSGLISKYDTYAFNNIVNQGGKIYCSSTYNLNWIEIDFLMDYERAKTLFSEAANEN